MSESFLLCSDRDIDQTDWDVARDIAIAARARIVARSESGGGDGDRACARGIASAQNPIFVFSGFVFLIIWKTYNSNNKFTRPNIYSDLTFFVTVRFFIKLWPSEVTSRILKSSMYRHFTYFIIIVIKYTLDSTIHKGFTSLSHTYLLS